MCTQLRFVTAVCVAVQELRSRPFSAYDVTKLMRSRVNDGSWAFSDRTKEPVDGQDTFMVSHDEVRDVFRELRHFNVIVGLQQDYSKTYVEYSDNKDTTAPATPDGLTLAPVLSFVPRPANCAPDFPQKVEAYLTARRASDIGLLSTGGSMNPVSMKQIQSRFKGCHCSCKTYAEIVAHLGHPVDTQGNNPSKWTVVF